MRFYVQDGQPHLSERCLSQGSRWQTGILPLCILALGVLQESEWRPRCCSQAWLLSVDRPQSSLGPRSRFRNSDFRLCNDGRNQVHRASEFQGPDYHLIQSNRGYVRGHASVGRVLSLSIGRHLSVDGSCLSPVSRQLVGVSRLELGLGSLLPRRSSLSGIYRRQSQLGLGSDLGARRYSQRGEAQHEGLVGSTRR